tara:strand:- start:875 stop:1336 length:462 start_codon:yes stop_codon:yes gene_type:complete
LKIKIISVGNTSPKWVKDEIVKYISMLDDCFKVELIDIKSNKNQKSIEQKKLQEAKKITKFINDDFVISLDESGALCTSKNLSKNLYNWMQNFSKITFIIGGADGLDKEILKNSNWVWSLSKLTFPHNLVKIILLEQLYRGSTILNKHPYHRE